MWVHSLKLSDYRNYQSAELVFRQGPNLLLGANGQGKTNAAEAINFFSTLSSHRVSQDTALIRAGSSSAILRMTVQLEEREVLLESQINRDGANRAQINRVAVKPRELLGTFQSVLFAPEDIQIVRGEPSQRRKFIDDAQILRKPQLSAVYQDFERVLKQRNALLKSARGLRNPGPDRSEMSSSTQQTMQVWNERLVELGSRIVCEREEYLRTSSAALAESYHALVGEDHAPIARQQLSVSDTVDASSHEQVAAAFAERLDELASQEIERAQTLVGPHRDDISFELNGLPVKGFASHGESWSFVLSLKLALAKTLRAESLSSDPVLILDDVFSELDSNRRARLFSAAAEFEQVIVTAAVKEDVAKEVDWNIIQIDAGQVIAS